MSEHAAGLYAPLRLIPGPSVQLGGWLVATHLTAAAAVVLTPMPPAVMPCLLLLIAASLLRAHRRHIARTDPRAVVEAVWEADGRWVLALAGGERTEARLQPDSFVSVPLVILNFSAGSRLRGHSLVLPKDALDPESLRKLRVRLKLARPEAGMNGVN